MKILELTDSFNLNRESIVIPLALGDAGSVTFLSDKRLRIVAPKNMPFEDWLVELRTRLESMGLSTMQH
jgi:hypothetical protein